MHKKKDTSNYFDDFELWSDTSAPRKQESSFSERPPKTVDDLDDFFDSYEGTVQTRNTSSSHRRTGRSGRRNPLGKILTGAAVAVCAVIAVLVIHSIDRQKPEPPSAAAPVVTQPAVLQPTYPAGTAPVDALAKPAPVPKNEYRYFGKKLNAEQKKIYDVIQEGLSRHADSVGPFNSSSLDEVHLIVQSILYDYPEYFWFHGAYETSYYDNDTYLECTINFRYEISAQEYAGYEAYVEAAAQPILEQLEGKSDYEKVKGVYEYLIDNTVYDLRYTGSTIYEMFHDRRGVCEGYARASQYLLTKLGVETLFCSGIAGEIELPKSSWESHAWNIVKIDGIYYGLDTTWGDPVHSDGTQTKSFLYLNLTDEEMERRHERENWNSYPACNSTLHNYYVQEGRYLETFDKEILKKWFREAYARGEYLEFKCAGEGLYRQVYSWLFQNNGVDELFRTVIPQNEGYGYSYGYGDDLYTINLGEN